MIVSRPKTDSSCEHTNIYHEIYNSQAGLTIVPHVKCLTVYKKKIDKLSNKGKKGVRIYKPNKFHFSD